ncbi:nucleoside hydrolase [Spirulina sp. 06S082]|uniref:nucleoside hydrolase n=1 Tax=Spirulina sp. 06S082 TaxID=3110248 RepID=UPI002B1FE826|nr:nucleoside hydrolase [Spirulina sp. 06S082]MEA5470994.1 nucleoside hydrolase [Spirulina sp. 06S082]
MTGDRNPIKIILDTDPGGDDIFALFWIQSLVKQGFAELVAITTAEGNVPAKYTFNAACQILELGDLENIPVGRGVDVPHKRFNDASHIHGPDGMGNLSRTLPEVRQSFTDAPLSDDLIIEKLQEQPGGITIIAIAPLNNLAAAEAKSPGILTLAREIIIMGGAFHIPGNVTPYAEFNMAFNPQAAKRVFNSRNDLVIFPLDVTQKLVLTRNMMEQIVRVNPQGQLTQFMQELADFLTQTSLQHRETKGEYGFLVHDALTLAYLFYPETLQFSRTRVSIETKGEFTTGQTLMDIRHSLKEIANAWVAVDVDVPGFFTCFLEDLKTLVGITID